MRKGIALRIPEELFEKIEMVAESEHEGDRNDAIQVLIKRGFKYEALRAEWEQASVWQRIRWAVSGWDRDEVDSE